MFLSLVKKSVLKFITFVSLSLKIQLHSVSFVSLLWRSLKKDGKKMAKNYLTPEEEGYYTYGAGAETHYIDKDGNICKHEEE